MSLTVLSLGAGVQSTTVALLAAYGEIPAPDCAIFADTGWEPRAVYEHLDRLEERLPFPVHRVSAGNLREDTVKKFSRVQGAGRFSAIPWFTSGGGMGRRQCTAHYKIHPLAKKQRELMGAKPRQRLPTESVHVLIGISTDEAHRMKPARNRWQRNVFPLIDLGMSRRDCLNWLQDRQWNAPKSSCIGCPFHSDAMWRDLRDNAPDEWADAVAVDATIRAGGNLRGIKAQQFMHRSLKPLDEVDLSTWAEKGQADLFGEECEGMCGL
jgi:3'-phosphoadenosine 5'-phosphosulfate sulfotransferase (PAPS reductase)/FAD synthetase